MQRALLKNINTPRYWNKLLKSGEWGKDRGRLHAKIATFLPRNQKLTCLDIGCATGHGTAVLAERRPLISFEGCDFSASGIRAARQAHGKQARFFLHDVRKDRLEKDYDYILLIETLEHLDKPLETILKYLPHCRKALLATVPYNETPGKWKEHVHTFNEHSFHQLPQPPNHHIFPKPDPKPHQQIILYQFHKDKG